MHKDSLRKEELESWKHNPVTEQVTKYLIDLQEQLKENFFSREILREDAEAQLSVTTQQVTAYRVLQEIIKIDYEDIAQFYGWNEEKNND